MDSDKLEFIIDSDECDARHNGIVVDLVLAIQSSLSRAGLSEEQVAKLTEEIGFDICSILDGSHEMIFA